MHGSMRRVRQKFAETEMNQHFGKTLATQDSHIHQTTISFTYTRNHHKLHIYTSHIHQTTTSFTYTLHIYIKSTTSFTYTLHIYIKQPQASHIHFTYTSNHHKLHIYTSNIHQNPSFTYTSSFHKLYIHIKIKPHASYKRRQENK